MMNWRGRSDLPNARLEDFMEYFRLDHPPDRLILCNRSKREDIADSIWKSTNTEANISPAQPTPAVKGMFQFCRRAYPVASHTEADLLRPDLLPSIQFRFQFANAQQ
jgi:hypothetical protein